MATCTGPRAGADVVPIDPNLGADCVVGLTGHIDIATAPAASDIYELLWVPAGFTAVGGLLTFGDMDTHGTETLEFNLGWAANGGSGTYDAADADGFGDFGVSNGDAFATPSISSQAGNIIPVAGLLVGVTSASGGPIHFTKKTKIQAVCVAVSETFAASRMNCLVWGHVDPSRVVG